MEATVTAWDNITAGFGNLMDLVGTMLTEVTSQPILCVFFVAGLASIAVGVLSQLKHA